MGVLSGCIGIGLETALFNNFNLVVLDDILGKTVAGNRHLIVVCAFEDCFERKKRVHLRACSLEGYLRLVGIKGVDATNKGLHIAAHAAVTVEGNPQIEMIVLDDCRIIRLVRLIIVRAACHAEGNEECHE